MAEHYGTPPGWRVEGYQIDKSGAVTLEVVKPWEPVLVGDGNSLVLPDIPTPPSISGFRIGGGGWKLTNGGMAISFNYEGVQPTPGGGAATGEEMGVRWSGRGSLFQKNVMLAESWDVVRTKYFWDAKKKEFPETLPSVSTVDSPWVNSGSDKVKLNPMRGVKSIDDYSAVITKTYLSVGIPAGIFTRINRIVKKPHSQLPDLGDRDWKYMSPDWEEHGDFFRIYEHLELSGPGGWNPDLFKKVGA